MSTAQNQIISNTTSRKNLIFICTAFTMLLFAWFLQSTLFLNTDVSTLLVATKRLLSGGNYVAEIFTPNPPLILYLYTLPVEFSNATGISIIIIFRIYIFFLALISLLFCYRFLQKISHLDRNLPVYLFTATLIIVFTLLPIHDFGERDHMLVMLSLPYVLMMTCRLKNIPINKWFAAITGFIAGLGFLMKPHFFIPLVFIELYYLKRTKNFFSWLRPETITISFMITIYVFCLYYFHPQYLSIVLPYLLKHYIYSTSVPSLQLIYNLPIIFCLLVIFFYFLQINNSTYKDLRTLLLLTLIGYMICFFLQRTTYYYHVIPPLSLAVILYILEFYLLATNPSQSNNSQLKSLFHILPMTLLLLGLLPIYITYDIYKASIKYKKYLLTPLIQFMNSQGSHKSIYVFSPTPRFGFPLIDYTNSDTAQRFDCLWMTDGLIKQIQREGDKNVIQHFKNNEYLFLKMLTEDINLNKPNFIFIDADNSKHHTSFSYLYYFLQNENFKKSWLSYNYLTKIEFKYTNRTLHIYRRN